MSRRVVVVEPGRGDRVGNVELLARTVDTPYFNLALVVLAPGQGVDGHVHRGEDDSWLVLEGTLTVTVGEERRVLHAGPGTYVLVPDGTYHALANESPDDVRFLNVHAPGGFDRRIGWRPRARLTAGLTVLLATLLLTVGLGGPASAVGLTRGKVQQIAAKVLKQQAPTLRVAHSASSDRATAAADADKLGGRAPAAYLDRVAFGVGPSGVKVQGTAPPVVGPLSITVPEGGGFVHATGQTAFQGTETSVWLFIAKGTACVGAVEPTPWAYGSSGFPGRSLTIDRVLEVGPGPQTFVLCAVADAQTTVYNPSLTIETVAAGATG